MCERIEVDDLMKKIEFVALKNSNSWCNSSDSSIAPRERERAARRVEGGDGGGGDKRGNIIN